MAAEQGDGLARIEAALARADQLRELGAFWCLDREGALRAAERVSRTTGGALPLAAAPVAVKDLFDVKGLPTSAGVPGHHPAARADAQAVRRLRAAGAVPIGKTAMDQLACTTGGQAPGFPDCVNPVDPALSPGGSSSGSAVAVAAGVVPLGLGTDTAGSIRVPAAYCGIVGFKPARRAIPRAGSVPVMPGFDTVGVLAPSVASCVSGYRALAGGSHGGGKGLRPGASPGRVGVLGDLLAESEGSVGSACERIVAELKASGVRLKATEIGWRAQGFGVALAWELSSIWGERVDADPDLYSPLIRDTIAFGRKGGASAYEEAVAGILRARERLRRRFAGLSAVICPTVPVAAPDRDRERTEVSTRFTRIFSALNWPAFSLPAGTDRAGRPIGIQVATPPSRTEELIAVARLVEDAAGRAGHT